MKLYCECGNSKNFERIILEELGKDDLMFEYIMLRLRLTEGLNVKDFNNIFSADFKKIYSMQINYLIKNNLLEVEGDNIRLTEKGMDISNYVIEEFME